MNSKSENILITGGAGFIGSHLSERLLESDNRVTVIDNFNSYYDSKIKRSNLKNALTNDRFNLIEGDVRNINLLKDVFKQQSFDVIVHLAAMAGVRPSLTRAHEYFEVNVLGTQNLLDRIMEQDQSPRFVLGSSSSVYGERTGDLFSEEDCITKPISPYAASKVSAELACHAAHKVSGIDVACLRFFTVYGPRQRPDLAIHKFVNLIETGQQIEVYGDGSTQRDYTYVYDIVSGIVSSSQLKGHGYEVFNLGRSKPIQLKDMISTIETALGKKANIDRKPIQNGDVSNTFANIEKAQKMLGYEPNTSFEEGIKSFVDWYRKNSEKL